MNKQSFITILLTMLMSMVNSKAFAHDIEAKNSDGVTIYYVWTNNNTELAVSYQGTKSHQAPKYSGTVNIPETVEYEGDTYNVTAIGNYAFYGCSNLTSITIPNGVISIGHHSFYGCTSLTSITIPNSVTDIGNDAFTNCCGLTSVELHCANFNSLFSENSSISEIIIGKEVTSISSIAFSNCSGLTSITVKNGNTIYDSRDNCNAIIEKSSNSLIVGCKNTIIPEDVASIGDYAFSACSDLTSVNIPDDVTYIGNYAFSGCSGLISISIPYRVVSIGNYAFAGCSNLTSIIIPDGVISIGHHSFYGCTSLTSITIPNSVTDIGNDAFTGCSGLTSIELHCATIRSWFSGNTSISEINIGKEVTSISSDAFRSCSGLTSITVENGNTTYDSRDNCNAIIEKSSNSLIVGCKNTIIPDDVTSIGNSAFSSCIGLVSVSLPNVMTSIGDYAFSGCSNLASVNIPDGVTSISNGTFWSCSGLTSVTIPDGVTSIGNYAFYGCSNLASVTIPEGVTSIGNYAFAYCSSLTSAIVPNSVTKMGISVFDNCDNLESLVIPEHITKRTIHVEQAGTLSTLIPADEKYVIEDLTLTGELNGTDLGLLRDMAGGGDIETMDIYLLTDATPGKLRVLDISDVNIVAGGIYVNYIINEDDGRWKGLPKYERLSNDNEIPNLLFCGCGSLSHIKLPNSITSIGRSAFAAVIDPWLYSSFSSISNNLVSVVIGSSVTSIGSNAFGLCNKLTSIKVNSDNQKYDSRNNCNAIIETSSNTLIIGCKNTIIPESVTCIGGSAFSDCSGLTSISIPRGVTTIGENAFQNCSNLVSVTLPNSVTNIHNSIFNGCNSLANIVVERGNNTYDSRDNCNAIIESATNQLIVGCNNTVIPNSVTSIGNNAFYDCSGLTSVTIPSNVTSIGNDAFENCSGLITVTIPNSVISIGNFAFYNCNALTTVSVDIQEPLAIDFYTFSNQANATLYVPKGSKAVYEAANVWKDFKETKEFAKDEEVTCALEEDNTATVTAANDPTEKDVVIPESVMIGEESHPVTAIGENAFKNNTELALACIPGTIDEIGDNAFAGCSNLKAIYCYNEEPIALGSDKATVRTRADGNETSATAVFADVDKTICILYVPLNSANKYRTAEGWGEFENIVEMKSNILGDANNDGEVDDKDLEATSAYIMEGKTDSFIFKNADVKTDSRINATDIVKIVNLMK